MLELGASLIGYGLSSVISFSKSSSLPHSVKTETMEDRNATPPNHPSELGHFCSPYSIIDGCSGGLCWTHIIGFLPGRRQQLCDRVMNPSVHHLSVRLYVCKTMFVCVAVRKKNCCCLGQLQYLICTVRLYTGRLPLAIKSLSIPVKLK